MSEDRPAHDPVTAIAELQKRLDDMETTYAARMARRPTGTVEPWIWATPPAGALLLQGQAVSRVTYADLWRVVQERGGITSGMFGAGDNATTFTLPDWRGRVPVGAGTLGADTYTLGQTFGVARHVLVLAEMPQHNHGGTTGTTSHSHNGSTSGNSGNHGNHNNGIRQGASALAGYQDFHFDAVSNADWGNAGHTHGFTTDSDSHSHTIPNAPTAATVAHENRPPSIAVHWIIWT